MRAIRSGHSPLCSFRVFRQLYVARFRALLHVCFLWKYAIFCQNSFCYLRYCAHWHAWFVFLLLRSRCEDAFCISFLSLLYVHLQMILNQTRRAVKYCWKQYNDFSVYHSTRKRHDHSASSERHWISYNDMLLWKELEISSRVKFRIRSLLDPSVACLGMFINYCNCSNWSVQ